MEYLFKTATGPISPLRGSTPFTSCNDEYYNRTFSEEELKTSLNRAHDTAEGPDKIHYQLLKHLPTETLSLLLEIYNYIWQSGDFPDCWSEATIIPIPKPGKDHSDPNNYRPIALTSCVCKTLERMINDRFVWYLESNNILTNIQCGFRKRRSTLDHLVRLESFIRDAFLNKQEVVSVFFDLEKAYDTTWKYGILQDLHQAGLRGRMPVFISHFLENRNFRVRLGSTLSDPYEQEMGVPQGSILSVTLFSLKINSLAKVLNKDVEGSLYVDDFLMSYKAKNTKTCERQLQYCLNKIEKWCVENGFKFSQTKSVCVHFHNKRSHLPEPELTLNGKKISVVRETKFLGVTFDQKQNRSTEGCSKLKRSVDMTSSGKNGLNIRTNASPKWDRTRCPEELSVLCWLAAPVAMFYGNLQNSVIRSKSVLKSSSVINSQIGVMSDQLRVSLFMVMSKNVM